MLPLPPAAGALLLTAQSKDARILTVHSHAFIECSCVTVYHLGLGHVRLCLQEAAAE